MLATYILTRCVKPCPPVLLRVGISVQRQIDFNLNKTRPIALKIWSCLIFNEKDQITKVRASIQPAERTKLTTSVSTLFVLIATLCLKQLAALTINIPAMKLGRLPMKRIFNVVVKNRTV